jgi:hypothetical protein
VPPTPLTENSSYIQHDHDFLIETEHNMAEYNSDFNRLSSTYEIRLNCSNEARQREALDADNMELGSGSGGIEEVCTAAPVRLVTSDGSHSHRHSAAQRNRSGPVSVSRTGSGLGSIRGSGGERGPGSGGGSGMRVRGPRFYSHNSANAVTLAEDRGRQSNDPCTQQ